MARQIGGQGLDLGVGLGGLAATQERGDGIVRRYGVSGGRDRSRENQDGED
jgi:hypothetical protein